MFRVLWSLLSIVVPLVGAELSLRVTDASGSGMAASGRVQSVNGPMSWNFAIDGGGEFVLRDVPEGRYRLEVRRSGFATHSELVEIQDAGQVSRTIALQVGISVHRVEVAGTTPLSGLDRDRNEVPSPVQTASAEDIANSGSADLAGFLNGRLNGVYLNEVQGNPYQADLNYRGYTASPLLGTPQGISVFMDGVRLNQPFGDTVSWDLIPRSAVAELALIPGSNPLFGLNTLGGSLSLQPKDGLRNAGTALQLSGGSFGRKTAELTHGGSWANGMHWFTAANLFFEDGWRETSPSNVRQFYGRLGKQGIKSSGAGSFGFANNGLIGNALQEIRMLQRDYASVYTKPDVTANRSPILTLSARHLLSPSLFLTGNFYYRHLRTITLNGDLNDDSLTEAVYQPSAAEIRALNGAGIMNVPASGATAANTPFPSLRCIAQAILRDEPAEKCNGLLNRSRTGQNNHGAWVQLGWFAKGRGFRSQLTAGGGYDRSVTDFKQSTELGYLNPDRSITGVASFGDGVTGGDVDGAPFDARVDLHGRTRTGSAYVTNTLSRGSAWNLTLSGRFNRTVIDNLDRILPSGSGSLTGRHIYTRFNPAVGLTFNPRRTWNAYLSYTEGSRAPTSIELGCADPENPCKLPNAMAGDPPLRQVTTATVEAGLRGGGNEGRLQWSLGWFHGQNRDDILFVTSEQTGYGYFKNFGRTRRQGVEADGNARIGRVTFGAGYTLLHSTFQSSEELNGEGNSSNQEALEGRRGMEGLIEVRPGDRMPLTPRHMVKLYGGVQATRRLRMDLCANAFSSSLARGNENNAHRPDGVYYLGEGESPGYAVANLGARFDVTKRVQLFAQVNNLFNRRYYTAAQLGSTGFTAQGTFLARPFAAVNGEFPLVHSTFLAPGAPRGVWAGMQFRF